MDFISANWQWLLLYIFMFVGVNDIIGSLRAVWEELTEVNQRLRDLPEDIRDELEE